MVPIIYVFVVCVAVTGLICPSVFEWNFEGKIKRNVYYTTLLVIIALMIRLLCEWLWFGHKYDTSCFRAWAARLADKGLAAFYSSDKFNNYPPGYMYILYLIGKIHSNIPFSDEVFNRILKLPAIIFDLISGLFIYSVARKRFAFNISLIIMSAWLFNPAVITDSALWGQVDIIYTFFICLMLYFIAEKKLKLSYFMFALAILFKPQAFIVTPILIYGIIEQVFLDGFDKRVFLKNLLYGIAAIGMMVLLVMPFGVKYVFEQYRVTLRGSACIVQNAFNLWGALGKNWNGITGKATITGFILLALSVAFVTFFYFRSRGKAKVYFAGGLLILCSFMLSVKMNERYAFAVMPLFLMAYMEMPTKNNAISYMLITLSQFFNIAWVLFVFETDFYKYYPSKWICFYSALNLIMFIYIIYMTVKYYMGKKSRNAKKL